MNATIQWVKKTAQGFRNVEDFKTAIYFHCGDLNLYPLESRERPKHKPRCHVAEDGETFHDRLPCEGSQCARRFMLARTSPIADTSGRLVSNQRDVASTVGEGAIAAT